MLERFEFLGVGDRTVVQARLLGVLLLGHRLDLVLEPHLVAAELVELQPEFPEPALGGIGELTSLGERPAALERRATRGQSIDRRIDLLQREQANRRHGRRSLADAASSA